jgi:hypothetical protein
MIRLLSVETFRHYNGPNARMPLANSCSRLIGEYGTECIAMVEPLGIEVYQNGGLIIETIAKLHVNLPWIVPVEAAEGQAIV